MSNALALTRQPSLFAAVLPTVILIGLLIVNVIIYGEDASYGPNQIALLFAAASAAVIGYLYGIKFPQMMNGIVASLGSAMGAILILLLIGSLAGTWMISGVVPALIYYGLDVLSPKIFLPASMLVCSIVSLASGSSWSTVATVGVALLGIANALGINEAMAAGAIISGAYFGDKISPLSDTTNLASAMSGTELFTHIRYMLWTTVPSLLMAFGIFFALGYSADATTTIADTDALKHALAAEFNLSPILFVVPGIVLLMVIMKFDAIVALFFAIILGGIFAIWWQPGVIDKVAGLDPITVTTTVDGVEQEMQRPQNYLTRSYAALVNAMAMETSVVSADQLAAMQTELDEKQLASARRQTGNHVLALVDFKNQRIVLQEDFPELKGQIAAAKLMNANGMAGMLNTIWLIVTAMCFGGVMEACGLLQRITDPLVRLARTDGSLIATTAGSCLFVNVTASDQYLAIVVPGRMFRQTYADRGLAPENLSRTLEDAGTVTSVLVPWNTCGATQQAILGVATLSFAPYCFFNIISPLMTILFGFVGIRIARLKSASETSA
jgi:Na+:H+ antiporter, NhaC family